MFKRLPFPWAYVLEPLLAVPLFVSFYFVVAFFASKPAEAIRATGVAIPAHWEAAVPNHGGYLPGFLPSNHPLLLATALISLAVFAFVAWQLRMAQAAQLRASPPGQAGRHRVAGLATFAAWAVVAWLLVARVLPYWAAA